MRTPARHVPRVLAATLATLALSALCACERPKPSQEGAQAPDAMPREALIDSAPGAAPGAPDPAGERPVIVCLGDSLTAGHGVAEAESWPALLQARLDARGYRYKVVNAGISGDTSAGGRARMDWLLRQRIDILIVELGANDGLRGIDPTTTQDNLDAIIQKGIGVGATVVLAGMQMPLNYGADFKRRYDAVFPALARRHGLPFIPFLLEGLAGRRELNLPDGIHPTGEGYTIVLETVWKTLAPLLLKP